ncbi:MAG: sodium/solute symporter [Vulcanimicrobiota bacterium]
MASLDWVVLVVYLGGMAAVGMWAGRDQHDTDDFLLGGRSIPWWAALLSLVATEISAATFLGAPEQGYIRDLSYLQFSIGTIAARFLLASVFIGAFYKAQVTTIYEFLRSRFGPGTNTITAGLFLFGRVFADGSRLFIAAITIEVVTGLSIAKAVLILAAVTILYTYAGGIKAVIYTDVAQAVVLVGSGLTLLLTLWFGIEGSSGDIFQQLDQAQKFRLFNFDGSPLTNAYHVMTAVIGGFFLTMATHGTDHDMVQRLLTCKTDEGSRRSMWLSGFLGLMVTITFMGVGMLLFIYLSQQPADAPLALKAAELREAGKNGHVLLFYALEILPSGVLGLVVAGVLAAAMSSLSSALNAMTATYINDFYRRHKPDLAPEAYLLASRHATFVIGILLAGFALLTAEYMKANPETDLLSLALGVMTFFYGGLLGIFLVALFSKVAGNDRTNLVAAIVSTLVVFTIARTTSLAWPWFIVFGTVVSATLSMLGRTPAEVLDR